MKIKIISVLICTLFLTSVFAGLTTAKNHGSTDTSVSNITVDLSRDPNLIKIADDEEVCDLDNDFVVYAGVSNLKIYNITTGETENVPVGGSIVFPKLSEKRVIYYDFLYMGFKMYDITTSEKTDLIVTNWTGGDTDDFQFYGDYIVYENTDSDQYSTEIFLYNIATGENNQLTDTPGEAFPQNPCIYKYIIAWQLMEGPLSDIVMYNIESSTYTRVTNTSQFESETFPSVYENTVAYSYFYYDKVNGTTLYGLKMYNIATEEETTIFTDEETTANSPELFDDKIVYSAPDGQLRLYDLSTNSDLLIYENTYLVQPWNLNENYVAFTVLGEGIYLYKFNNPPAIEITIQGGLGVSATIKNVGTTNLTNISWNIMLDGKLIFIGKNKSGTIDSLAAGESKTVRDLVLGLGKTSIAVTAGPTTRNTTGTVILFFVIGVE
ncbi:MAG: hypothetical protein NTY91_03090 [Euryarchaeota archaeon]|nr:hypothetical protein [Euryarchaeota archaeon]